jgi:hypothetical protein
MDPYLEQRWADIHATLIVYARNQLNPQLPDDLDARVEENLSVEQHGDFVRTIAPDVRVTEDAERVSFRSETGGATTVALAEPLLITIEPRLRHLEIVNPAGRVITAIEFLSPRNKIGEQAHRKYGRKQDGLLSAGVNLVEIDLIRQGRHVALAPLEAIPEPRRGPYLISVHRHDVPAVVKAYPVSLRDPLPNIRIPLRPTDPDVVLQLQPLLDACYRDARCDRMNYQQPPVPPLPPADAAWAESLVRDWRR